ncbi:MAG: 16S rRNA processing protein RimM [Spirochaetes bacterium GWF1_51_8]|nr:MAG: 16S rRNA processing protein RimM [Spirochaetes bacterium GWF1_51_8]
MKKLLIGKIVKPFGIRGEVFLDFFVDGFEELEFVEKFYIEDHLSADGFREFEIEEVRESAKAGADAIRVIANISVVPDRNAAELFRGRDIYIDEESLPAPGENEFYIKDLMGNEVFFGGERFGTADNLIEIGNRYMFFIKRTNNETVAIPMEERYIERIDVGAKQIYLRSIEDLI